MLDENGQLIFSVSIPLMEILRTPLPLLTFKADNILPTSISNTWLTGLCPAAPYSESHGRKAGAVEADACSQKKKDLTYQFLETHWPGFEEWTGTEKNIVAVEVGGGHKMQQQNME